MADGAHGFRIAIEIKALVLQKKIGVTWNFGNYPPTTTPVLVNIRVILYQGYDMWKNRKANCSTDTPKKLLVTP